MCDFFFMSSCTEECLCVLVHSFVISLEDLMFPCFFASFPSVLLDRLCCSSVFFSPPTALASVFVCFLFVFFRASPFPVSVSLFSWLVFKQGSRALWEFLLFFLSFWSFSVFDCFTVTVYVDSLFSLDSVFSRNSNFLDDKPVDTFFLADTESQGLPPNHLPWRTGGIKAAAALQTTASPMWMRSTVAFSAQYVQISRFKHTAAAFYEPCFSPPLTDILSNILFIFSFTFSQKSTVLTAYPSIPVVCRPQIERP